MDIYGISSIAVACEARFIDVTVRRITLPALQPCHV